MKITQLSVFAENKPGYVIAPCRRLADAGVSIRAISLAETQRFGVLRIIVSDWQAAAKLLQEAGFMVKPTEVLAIEVPGGSARPLHAAGRGREHRSQYRIHVRLSLRPRRQSHPGISVCRPRRRHRAPAGSRGKSGAARGVAGAQVDAARIPCRPGAVSFRFLLEHSPVFFRRLMCENSPIFPKHRRRSGTA